MEVTLAGMGVDGTDFCEDEWRWNRHWTGTARDGNDICGDGWGWMQFSFPCRSLVPVRARTHYPCSCDADTRWIFTRATL